jgi:hypothetical protein
MPLLDTINKSVFDATSKLTGNVGNINNNQNFSPVSSLQMNLPSIPEEVKPSDKITNAGIVTDNEAGGYLSATDKFLANMKLSQEAHKTNTANQTVIDTQNKQTQDAINAQNKETETLKSIVSEEPIGSKYDTEVSNIQTTIDKIKSDTDTAWNKYYASVQGAIPLNTAQQAIMDSTAAEYQSTKDELEQSYKNLAKGTEIANIVSGRNRYAPEMAMGNVQKVINDGAKQITELNSKMSLTLAELQEGFDEKNYTKLNDAWTKYSAYQKEKTDSLQTQQKALQDAKKELVAQNKDQRDYELELYKLDNSNWEKQQSLISDVVKEAGKNNAPSEVINAIYSSATLADAVNAAGEYMQSGTGIVAEYQYYKRQAESLGQTPVDFSTYQNIDANRKKSIAAATGVANGISNATLTKVQTISNQFDGEQIVKDYNQIIQSIDAVRNAGTSPADDIQRIYAFAKIMDPNSVVREGEYATVKKYSQTWLGNAGKELVRVVENKGFLSQEARELLLKTLENRLSSTEKAYNNLTSEYGRRINKITGGTDGTEYITDYSKPFQTANELLNSDNPLQIGNTQTNSNNPMGL